MIDDADFDEPTTPKARPGKAAHAAPDPTAARTKAAPTELTISEGDKLELAELVTDKPADVLFDEEKREALYARLRNLVAEYKPDLTTQAGRDRIKSFAYKIVRTRTALEAAAKERKDELRKAAASVDELTRNAAAAIKKIEEEARRPLTEWEARQEEIAAAKRQILLDIANAVTWAHRQTPPATLEECQELLAMVEDIVIDPEIWAGDDAEALETKQLAISQIRAKIENLELRAKLAEKEQETLNDAAPGLEPVIDDQEPAPIIRNGGQAAESRPVDHSPQEELTPIQRARRAALPALAELGIEGDTAKRLILAIEKGHVPGVIAAYMKD